MIKLDFYVVKANNDEYAVVIDETDGRADRSADIEDAIQFDDYELADQFCNKCNDGEAKLWCESRIRFGVKRYRLKTKEMPW